VPPFKLIFYFRAVSHCDWVNISMKRQGRNDVFEVNINVFYFLINALRFFQQALCMGEFTESFVKVIMTFLWN
jgi:hypothetical protein